MKIQKNLLTKINYQEIQTINYQYILLSFRLLWNNAYK